MRNRILLLFLGTLLFTGCIKEDLVQPGRNVPEGEPALVNLKMDMATMGSRAKSRTVPDDLENKIENLRVMIFDARGVIVTNQKPAGPFTTTGTSPLSLNISTYSGSGRTIGILANVHDATMDTKLAGVSTYQELKDIVVTATDLGFGLNKDRPLMMTAVQENVDILPGNNAEAIGMQLQFMTAKLTLEVTDNTPAAQLVTIIGWDVVDASMRSFVFNSPGDAAATGSPDHWLTTNADYPFENEATGADGKKTVTQGLYIFENRRGGRVRKSLPPDGQRYPGMGFEDTDHRGKGWFRPERATAIVIRAMHKTATETKQIKAYIYLGGDNHSNYDIERGKHYTFTVTVNGLDDIMVDSSIDYETGDFTVDHGDNLIMDAHPDFRPMRIHAPRGVASMEILDQAGRTHADPDFEAKWLKISPLNLMYHQVKQTGEAARWQQDANPTSNIVRGRYIPHTGMRKLLPADKHWWTKEGITVTDDDDDEMAFADATYRMCYKITGIPFEDAAAVTNRTLYVYADEYFRAKGTVRTAQVRFTFYKEGGDMDNPEEKIFQISQDGYIEVFDTTNPDAGLAVFNEDGKPSNIKKQFVFENTEEVTIAVNPGIDPALQRTNSMQWGFDGLELYKRADKDRNGKYLTANAVYGDVAGRDSEQNPLGFGKAPDSYRDMYGNGKTGGISAIPAYTGSTSGAPYYYPDAFAKIYHPIYKSSAARYCHEKNRDVNGDGTIDESEAHWYLPSRDQLFMAWIEGLQDRGLLRNYVNYWSATEDGKASWSVYYIMCLSNTQNKIHYANSVRCVRDL